MSAEQDVEHRTMPTARERAEDALTAACDGWRANRRCTDDAGLRLPHPHAACLQAHYRHDVIDLDGGIPR